MLLLSIILFSTWVMLAKYLTSDHLNSSLLILNKRDPLRHRPIVRPIRRTAHHIVPHLPGSFAYQRRSVSAVIIVDQQSLVGRVSYRCAKCQHVSNKMFVRDD